MTTPKRRPPIHDIRFPLSLLLLVIKISCLRISFYVWILVLFLYPYKYQGITSLQTSYAREVRQGRKIVEITGYEAL